MTLPTTSLPQQRTMTEADNITDQFPSTPPPLSLSPPVPAPITPQRSAGGDECFRCRKLGHWAKECPNKTPEKSPSSSSSPGSAGNFSDLPLVRCPCNRGTCRVLTSKTSKNPDRKFYTCPLSESMGKCNFFKWCDKLSERVPVCPCGVGKCSLSREFSGPDEGKWYFSCRIKRNFGKCDFFQWADPEINSMMKGYAGQSKGYSSGQPLFNTANAGQSDQDEVPNRDLVIMQKGESCKPIKRKAPQVFQSTTQLETPHLKKVWRQISNAGDTISEGIFPSFDPIINAEDADISDVEGPYLLPNATLSAETEKSPSQTPEHDAQVSGGALHESLGIKDPPCTIQDDFVLSKSPSQTPGHDAQVSGSALHESLGVKDPSGTIQDDFVLSKSPSQTPGYDAQVSGSALHESLGVKDPSGTVQDDIVLSKSILKTLGQSLLNIFKSMKPLDPQKMLKVAESFFIPLQNLSIECDSFVEAVKDYIHNVSKVTSIEESMGNRLSYQELSNLHENEKVRSNNVSRLHSEVLAEYRASNDRCQSLQEEILHIKSVLVEREKQLFCCEAETSALKARVDEISVDLLESNKNLEAVALDMAGALQLERQRELFSNAAGEALVTATISLE